MPDECIPVMRAVKLFLKYSFYRSVRCSLKGAHILRVQAEESGHSADTVLPAPSTRAEGQNGTPGSSSPSPSLPQDHLHTPHL